MNLVETTKAGFLSVNLTSFRVNSGSQQTSIYGGTFWPKHTFLSNVPTLIDYFALFMRQRCWPCQDTWSEGSNYFIHQRKCLSYSTNTFYVCIFLLMPFVHGTQKRLICQIILISLLSAHVPLSKRIYLFQVLVVVVFQIK